MEIPGVVKNPWCIAVPTDLIYRCDSHQETGSPHTCLTTDITCWVPAQESALTDRFVDNVIIINCCLLPVLSTALLLLFCFYLLIFAVCI